VTATYKENILPFFAKLCNNQ